MVSMMREKEEKCVPAPPTDLMTYLGFHVLVCHSFHLTIQDLAILSSGTIEMGDNLLTSLGSIKESLLIW